MADTAQSLILVANPGSASRKYALYDSALTERAQLHFEHVGAFPVTLASMAATASRSSARLCAAGTIEVNGQANPIASETIMLTAPER